MKDYLEQVIREVKKDQRAEKRFMNNLYAR